MKLIKSRIKQLELQIDNPEVLDQKRVECKLEAFRECLQLIKSENLPNYTEINKVADNYAEGFDGKTNGMHQIDFFNGALWLKQKIEDLMERK